jgi:hypothetical protein
MKAFAPNGLQILGTLEMIQGRAEIECATFGRDEKGVVTFEYAGDTEIFWDEQKTAQKNGHDIFLDEEGWEWTEEELVLREDDEE